MGYRKRNAPAKCGELISYGRGCKCKLCKEANAKYHRENRTKESVRKSNLKQTHKMSLEDYENLMTQQKGVCASCGNPETGKNQHGILPLAVDHCHITNNRRGLLCMRCNRALGLLRDDPIVIEQLLSYIKRYK